MRMVRDRFCKSLLSFSCFLFFVAFVIPTGAERNGEILVFCNYLFVSVNRGFLDFTPLRYVPLEMTEGIAFINFFV